MIKDKEIEAWSSGELAKEFNHAQTTTLLSDEIDGRRVGLLFGRFSFIVTDVLTKKRPRENR